MEPYARADVVDALWEGSEGWVVRDTGRAASAEGSVDVVCNTRDVSDCNEHARMHGYKRVCC